MSVNKRRGSGRSGGSSTATASASKKSVRAAEQDRPDVAAARTAWADNQPKFDPDRLIFIDETGTSTKRARRARRREPNHGTGAVEAVELFALVLGLIRAKLPPLRANQLTCSSGWGSRDTASLREHTTRPDSLSTFHPGFRAVPASPKRRQARFQKVPLAS